MALCCTSSVGRRSVVLVVSALCCTSSVSVLVVCVVLVVSALCCTSSVARCISSVLY